MSRLKWKNKLAAAVLVIVILGGGVLAVRLSGPSPGAALRATILERIRGETPQAKMHAYVCAVLRGDEEAALDAWMLRDPELSNGRSDALRERRQDVTQQLIAAELDANYMIMRIEWWTTCCEPGVTCDARNAGGARIHVQFLDRDGLPLAYVFDVFHRDGPYWGSAAGNPPRRWALYDVYPRDEEPLFWRYVYEPNVRSLDWPSRATIAAPEVQDDRPTSSTLRRDLGEPADTQNGAFAASQAALADYEPVQNAGAVVEALARECAAWLSESHDPAALSDALRALPKLATAEVKVDVVDLNGDDLSDVVVEPHFIGLSVLGCLARQPGRFTCQALPATATFGIDHPPLIDSGVLSQDLIGDGRPATVVTYTVQGGGGWTELLYAFHWGEATSPDLIFHVELVNWAGRSKWRLETEPASPERQQIALTYPHFYRNGFDAKMVNHPLGHQIWRWDGDVAQFVLIDQYVDLTQSGHGPEAEITAGDRLRWLTNEGETVFRSGRYAEALTAYEEALAFAAAEDCAPEVWGPDWVGLLRFRRAQTAAYLGRAAEALSGMQAVTSDYEDDLLGELATAFLAGYGDGARENAATEAYTALQSLEERVHDQFYYERKGTLRFPMDAEGILCCAPGSDTTTASDTTSWPRVGSVDMDLIW